MRKIPLTKGKSALVDDEDFEFLSQWKWYYNGGYSVRGCKVRILMHRVINKTADEFITDHINRNKLDNRNENLRAATRSLNNFNTKIRSDNNSGEKGIHWSKVHSKWRPSVSKGGKRFYCGLYESIRNAVIARDNLIKKIYGQC